nr:hypothetical protein [uncultured Psychroserpens sp.]
MKNFIFKIILFLMLGYLVGEVIVRTNKLTSDIPQRYIENGIQKYLPGQKGYYKGASEPWEVNEYGWLGVDYLNTRPNKVSVIGDSYIENIMNPITCNQGYLLQELNKNTDFFEAGRSGVTFIEAMEITKQLDSLDFDSHMIYVSEQDFNESFTEIVRYTDRMQIDLDKGELLNGQLKSSGMKKILYNCKFLYYLYLRFPLFVNKQNKGEIETVDVFDVSRFDKLYSYCKNNYELNKIILVFHPNTSKEIIDFFDSKGVQHIDLEETSDQPWALNAADGHWNCHGHKEASQQITKVLSVLNL